MLSIPSSSSILSMSLSTVAALMLTVVGLRTGDLRGDRVAGGVGEGEDVMEE